MGRINQNTMFFKMSRFRGGSNIGKILERNKSLNKAISAEEAFDVLLRWTNSEKIGYVGVADENAMWVATSFKIGAVKGRADSLRSSP